MPKLRLDRPGPLVYLITDRLSLPDTLNQIPATTANLSDFIQRALTAGVDLLQIRERDLSVRDTLSIAEAAVQFAKGTGAHILVNDRADVARCAGAGVHLTTRSLTANVVRRSFGPDIIIGASTHNLEEAMAAESSGADFVVFGPVFETTSKQDYGPPVGVGELRMVARRLRIPVLALGGITLANFPDALDAGAAGIAAISLFASASDLETVVRSIKGIGGLSSN